ncbi:MAG TPA: hypothetical protein PLA43_10015 [Bryobacteraceae bacterium]|nr:hypothetical protein [Bryobacteraceae bacterium]HOL73160.1 hypothetical protein [Bryobacteraceae bacterium]HOQ46281.1 hypothetical protein [Bryobacteraceae bacterium]HPU72282.1 hypothetical protein [Bryobacteraceae bacterium]
MAKPNGMFEVNCPCCKAVLKIDPETRAVITFEEPEQPRTVEDLAAAVERLKGEAGRREAAFQKSFEAEKMQAQILSKKFDELLKKAKESPLEPPPHRDIDLD